MTTSPLYSPEDINILKFRSQQGDRHAQYELGMRYRKGEGVPQDFYEAFVWILKAAEQGHVPSQIYVAMAYQVGQGVALDDIQAGAWYRKAFHKANEDRNIMALDLLQKVKHESLERLNAALEPILNPQAEYQPKQSFVQAYWPLAFMVLALFIPWKIWLGLFIVSAIGALLGKMALRRL